MLVLTISTIKRSKQKRNKNPLPLVVPSINEPSFSNIGETEYRILVIILA
jgi:hypothetical protein